MSELPKTFDPAAIEARWYEHWEGEGLFRPARDEAEPFTIVIPPPNVTGSLHIGHALDNTLQDILIRHARLQGKDALWVVGTDHAGIATQMVVERQLNAQGIKRTDLTRDEFIERVWAWKEESGGTITGQLRRLGASCDWANERFTMDEGFSRAVIKVFVDLYNQKLLYRDKRLVNWDPGLKTAISDLEVETREVQGKFWHFRYPLEDGSGGISVATTRPETMLADMAVAVNPGDDRYKALIGKHVRLPITGRLIPIIADEHADPELGSGAVKITPGHDFNDFEVGKRAGFKPAEMLNMLDAEARLVQCGGIPDELIGLDRFEARARVVEMIEAAGLLEKIEDRVIQTPYGDRSGAVIEPWLTDQWYVDAKTLAGPAIDAVRNGDIRVVPETWKKTWFNWLENIQPWCVSRQLWWGHQIPAWYGPAIGQDQQSREDGTFAWLEELPNLENVAARTRSLQPEVFVAEDADAALALAKKRYSSVGIDLEKDGGFRILHVEGYEEAREKFTDGVLGLWRDSDVLDTWFSSALWPFGTLGWPEQTPLPLAGGVGGGTEREVRDQTSTSLPPPNPLPEGRGSLLSRHYPNDVLISGFDILFFWDARMAMQGLHFMKEVPWKTLYLHGLVRDAHGAKMSKSKGNTVDPLGLIDRYGADALRFTLAAMESQGRDIKLDEKRVEGYRNFATKLWNASRFCQANGIGASATIEPPAADLPVNRWIIAETVKTIQALDLALADLRYDESANTIYHFVWSTFCDWYLELIKTQVDEETKAVAGWVLDQILVMLHPFMPFITEELWHAMGERPYDLIVAKWPMADARALDPEAAREIDWLIRLVSSIRAVRSELNVPPGAKLSAHVDGADEALLKKIQRHGPAIMRLARMTEVGFQNYDLKIVLEDGSKHPFLVWTKVQGGAAQIVVDEATFVLPLEGVIDLAAERARLEKGIAAAEKEREALARRLASPGFVEKAKPEAIAKARADHDERASDAERLKAALARLG